MIRAVSDYDVIGRTYAAHRRPDPRIARSVDAALGDAETVINVGAGAGSYEPTDRRVVAVEPSGVMIAQRPAGSAPAVRAAAERLPFADDSFDAAMAVLTVHHWADRRAGLSEMRRVARERVAVVTWDPAHPAFWLTRDYFPDIIDFDRDIFPGLAEVEAVWGPVEVSVIRVPHDCADGFLGAYWQRPAAYLDERVRAGISSFARLGEVPARIERLRRDLETGRWAAKNAEILNLEELDIGYRLVTARLR